MIVNMSYHKNFEPSKMSRPTEYQKGGLKRKLLLHKIVCGISEVVMGAVACIESRAAFTRLGLGVPAGLLTVIAASSSIQTSRGFGGYRSSTCGEGSLLRVLGPNFVLAVILTLLWALACGLQFLLSVQAVLTVKHSRDSHTSFLVAIIQLVLSSLTLLAVILVLRINCIYDPD